MSAWNDCPLCGCSLNEGNNSAKDEEIVLFCSSQPVKSASHYKIISHVGAINAASGAIIPNFLTEEIKVGMYSLYRASLFDGKYAVRQDYRETVFIPAIPYHKITEHFIKTLLMLL